MTAPILWIEGKRADSPQFIPGLRKEGYQVFNVQTGDEALGFLATLVALRQFLLPRLSWLPENTFNLERLLLPELVVINAASLRSSGKRICSSIRKQYPSLPILLIANPEFQITEDAEACTNLVLKLPFTLRKLINRIKHLLPWEGSGLFIVGPICLDTNLCRVRCGDRESRLTPRLTALLQILMEHPGEVIERSHLFREAWKTEYTQDTRALDVHISWLRRAIEEDPHQPQFLKTVRGVGYRLDV